MGAPKKYPDEMRERATRLAVKARRGSDRRAGALQKALPGFQQDIDALSDMQTKKMALDMLALVRDGKAKGMKLDDYVDTGDLGDCYKLYFDRWIRQAPVPARLPVHATSDASESSWI